MPSKNERHERKHSAVALVPLEGGTMGYSVAGFLRFARFLRGFRFRLGALRAPTAVARRLAASFKRAYCVGDPLNASAWSFLTMLRTRRSNVPIWHGPFGFCPDSGDQASAVYGLGRVDATQIPVPATCVSLH
jgi:hypothetical protein